MKRVLQKADLVEFLREGGVDQTRLLMMHSSLHSLGRVDGGAETVIDAVLEVLGADGTLMVPTFNYVLEMEVFDPATVHSQTGLITNTLRQRPEAVRSLHPTYSVAAIGRHADEFTREHWKEESVGIGSPLTGSPGPAASSCCWGSNTTPTPPCTWERPTPKSPTGAFPMIPTFPGAPRCGRLPAKW